jgi:predicted N-acyltransferase
MVLPKRRGRPIAGALNFIGSDALYGRYWGALEEHPCLHFEVCYYQAIDFAIEHKLARGYLPVQSYSAHWIWDPGLLRAFADYLKRERLAVAHEIALLGEESPYRRSQ